MDPDALYPILMGMTQEEKFNLIPFFGGDYKS
jgi:hypothetical protein